MTTDDVEVFLESSRRGCWICATLTLADGSKLELRVPGVVGVTATSLADPLGETPVIAFTNSQGVRRRANLSQFGLL